MRPQTLSTLVATCLCLTSQSFALKAYYLGNSLTDCLNYDAFKSSVLTLDNGYQWGRHMIPGTPLDVLWQSADNGSGIAGELGGLYPEALSNYAWDVVTLQPASRGLANWNPSKGVDECCDTDSISVYRFMNYAKGKSPDAQFLIYATWPYRCSDYDSAWTLPFRPYDPSEAQRNISTGAYFERLTLAAQRMNTGMKKPLMIPAGHVFHELSLKIKAGRVPGIASIFDFYTDYAHLNSRGSYIVACAFYAVMYKRNPSELPYASFSVNSDLAAIIQQTAWEVASTNPYCGIASVGAAQQRPVRARQRSAALSSWREFTLSGKVLPASGYCAGKAVNQTVRPRAR